MSAQGRGPDSTLVHMSPREVSGLQSLAMAHGGTLTINPQTGLPEAGFLDSLLPTLIGGAATYFTGGAINPAVIAAAVGGLTALTSKDLGKGLMAGLGAYGGAGIMEGLAGFGAADIGEKAISSATADATAAGLTNQVATEGTEIAAKAAQDAYAAAVQKGVGDRMAGASYSDRLAAGASKALSNPGDAFRAVGGGSTFKGAAMIGAPIVAALASQDQTSVPTAEQIKFNPRDANLNITRRQLYPEDTGSSAERKNFGPTNVTMYGANGGLMSLAPGGSVDPNYNYSGYGNTNVGSSSNYNPNNVGQKQDLRNIFQKTLGSGDNSQRAKDYYLGQQKNLGFNDSDIASLSNNAFTPQQITSWKNSAVASTNEPGRLTSSNMTADQYTNFFTPYANAPAPGNPTPVGPTNPVLPYKPPNPPVPAPVTPTPEPVADDVSLGDPSRTGHGDIDRNPDRNPKDSPVAPTVLSVEDRQAAIDKGAAIGNAYINRPPDSTMENPSVKPLVISAPNANPSRDVLAEFIAAMVAAQTVNPPYAGFNTGATKPATGAKGGLMSLAPGGYIDPDYDYSGYGRKKTEMPVTTPVKPVDISKPDFLAADGKTYRYDPVKRSWYVIKEADAKTNAGVETLMGTGGPGGNDAIGYNPFDNPGGVRITPDMPLPLAYITGKISNMIEGQRKGPAAPIEDRVAEIALRNMQSEQAVAEAAKNAAQAASYSGLTGSQAREAEAQEARAAEAQAQANREASTSTAPAPAPAPAPASDTAPSSGTDFGNADSSGTGFAGDVYAYGGMTGYAQGGLGSLGGYSDGGRLLRGPGDGVSDSIPATVGGRQPARLADGEFVVPARIVSELGNGSTEAGARALYKMMDRIQANRRKTTGKNSVAVNSKSHKYLPA